MKIHHLKKSLLVSSIIVIILISIPTLPADTDHYSNGIIIVSGKCNTVTKNGLWLLGLTYINNKEITIQAQGQEGEKINILIFPPDYGLYISYEVIEIHLEDAKGFLFWTQKSVFFGPTSNRVFILCNAGDIWIIK